MNEIALDKHGVPPSAPTAQRRWVALIDAVLGPLIEIPAALLVVVEIIVLLAGVISRYVFHSPIVWSDELASLLFLWLAMLGAVVALRRSEHMAASSHCRSPIWSSLTTSDRRCGWPR